MRFFSGGGGEVPARGLDVIQRPDADPVGAGESGARPGTAAIAKCRIRFAWACAAAQPTDSPETA